MLAVTVVMQTPSTKYTTLQIIAMMADWRSWRLKSSGRLRIQILSNGKVEFLLPHGCQAFKPHPTEVVVLWNPSFLTYLITRPFWWYLRHKVKA